jgi:ribosomal protein L37AE/L43A
VPKVSLSSGKTFHPRQHQPKAQKAGLDAAPVVYQGLVYQCPQCKRDCWKIFAKGDKWMCAECAQGIDSRVPEDEPATPETIADKYIPVKARRADEGEGVTTIDVNEGWREMLAAEIRAYTATEVNVALLDFVMRVQNHH